MFVQCALTHKPPFSAHWALVTTQLKVELSTRHVHSIWSELGANWCVSTISNIFSRAFVMNMNAIKKAKSSWVYLCVYLGRIWLYVIHLMILDLRCIPNSDSLTLWRSKCMHSHPWPRWQTRLLQPKDQPTSATRGSPNHDLCKLSTRSSQKHTVVRWIPIWSTVDQKTYQKWPHLWDLWVFF